MKEIIKKKARDIPLSKSEIAVRHSRKLRAEKEEKNRRISMLSNAARSGKPLFGGGER